MIISLHENAHNINLLLLTILKIIFNIFLYNKTLINIVAL